jgi:hypothetical protein
MSLFVGNREFSVLQSSATALKISDAQLVPEGDGIIEISVDGRPHRREIRVLAQRPRPNWVAIEDR